MCHLLALGRRRRRMNNMKAWWEEAAEKDCILCSAIIWSNEGPPTLRSRVGVFLYLLHVPGRDLSCCVHRIIALPTTDCLSINYQEFHRMRMNGNGFGRLCGLCSKLDWLASNSTFNDRLDWRRKRTVQMLGPRTIWEEDWTIFVARDPLRHSISLFAYLCIWR